MLIDFLNLNIEFTKQQERNSVKHVLVMANTLAVVANAIRTTMEVVVNTWMNAAAIQIAVLKGNVLICMDRCCQDVNAIVISVGLVLAVIKVRNWFA